MAQDKTFRIQTIGAWRSIIKRLRHKTYTGIGRRRHNASSAPGRDS